MTMPNVIVGSAFCKRHRADTERPHIIVRALRFQGVLTVQSEYSAGSRILLYETGITPISCEAEVLGMFVP
jgi:hypothetical protein